MMIHENENEKNINSNTRNWKSDDCNEYGKTSYLVSWLVFPSK